MRWLAPKPSRIQLPLVRVRVCAGPSTLTATVTDWPRKATSVRSAADSSTRWSSVRLPAPPLTSMISEPVEVPTPAEVISVILRALMFGSSVSVSVLVTSLRMPAPMAFHSSCSE